MRGHAHRPHGHWPVDLPLLRPCHWSEPSHRGRLRRAVRRPALHAECPHIPGAARTLGIAPRVRGMLPSAMPPGKFQKRLHIRNPMLDAGQLHVTVCLNQLLHRRSNATHARARARAHTPATQGQATFGGVQVHAHNASEAGPVHGKSVVVVDDEDGTAAGYVCEYAVAHGAAQVVHLLRQVRGKQEVEAESCRGEGFRQGTRRFRGSLALVVCQAGCAPTRVLAVGGGLGFGARFGRRGVCVCGGTGGVWSKVEMVKSEVRRCHLPGLSLTALVHVQPACSAETGWDALLPCTALCLPTAGPRCSLAVL